MPSILWGPELAEVYDATYSAQFHAASLTPTVEFLFDLAGGGPALEVAVGTGRVALALSARGVPVQGIELSPHMVEQMRPKPGAEAVPVVVGDMKDTRVEGTFTLVYLVANTIMNVTTRRSRWRSLPMRPPICNPGATSSLEVLVPQLRRVPSGEMGRIFTLQPDHVGIETFDDLVGQVA